MEFRSMYGQLADRTVEIDVGNPPGALILAHQIIQSRRLAVRLGNLRLHHNFCAVGPLAGDLQLLARIAVEAIGISCGDVVSKRPEQLLLLGRGEGPPSRTDGEPRHRGDVECPIDGRGQSGVTPAFPERPAIPHRAEQNTVKASYLVLWIRNGSPARREYAESNKQREAWARTFASPGISHVQTSHISVSSEAYTPLR